MPKDKALGMLPDDDAFQTDPEEVKEEPVKEQTDDDPFKTKAEAILDTGEPQKEPEKEPEGKEPAEKQKEEEPTEDAKLLQRFGLHRQFNTVEDALANIPRDNKYRTELERERAELRGYVRTLMEQRRQEEKPAEQPLTGDAFLEALEKDPHAALRSAGFVTRSEAERIADERTSRASELNETNRFIDTAPRIKELWPRMQELFAEDPDWQRLPTNKMMKTLYKIAEAENPPQQQKQPVAAANSDKRDRANTAGGGKAGGKQPTAAEVLNYFATAPLEEIEKNLGYGD